MRLRLKKTKELCSSSSFNVVSLNEVIIYFDNDCTSDYISNYDVWLTQKKAWKDLSQAFIDKDVITDNYNTRFFEPSTEEDRERGYTL